VITRIEFAIVVHGPSWRPCQSYIAKDWRGWTARVDGDTVVLEGERRRVEVPRSQCVIYSEEARPEAASPPAKVDRRTKAARAARSEGVEL
jgi:hypothetical protein